MQAVHATTTMAGKVPLVQVYLDGSRRAVGVLSKYAPNCALGSPSIFTRLPAYDAWFLQIAGQQSANTV